MDRCELFLALVICLCFQHGVALLSCEHMHIVDANHTLSISTSSQDPFQHSLYNIYCWNITSTERMGLRASCRFLQSQPKSIYVTMHDHNPDPPWDYWSSERLPAEMFTGRRQIVIGLDLLNSAAASASCEVQPYPDNSDLICGSGNIALDDRHLLSVSIPDNRLSLECVWLITTVAKWDSFVVFLDLLSLNLRDHQKLSFGLGHDTNNRSSLLKEIDSGTFKSENGSSYFFFDRNLWISVTSFFNLDNGEERIQTILLRSENFTNAPEVECATGQVLCTIDSKCIPVHAVCDGKAHCSDYTDEGGSCDCCGASDLVLHLDEPLTILADAIEVEGTSSSHFTGFYGIYPGSEGPVPDNSSSHGVTVTQYKEEPMQFECVWRVTEPAGTRIRLVVEEFSGTRIVLTVGNGYDPVNEIPILVLDTNSGSFVLPAQILSTGQGMWLTLGLSESYGYLSELRLVFSTYNTTDCDVSEFACPSGMSCLENKSHVCNGERECPGYGDELGCGVCEKHHFACALTGECVPRYQICNGKADCNDHSDEFLCGYCGSDTIRTRPKVTQAIVNSNPTVECLWTVQSEVGTKIQANIRKFPRWCRVTFTTTSDPGDLDKMRVIRTIDSVSSYENTAKFAYLTSISTNESVMWIAKECATSWFSDVLAIDVRQFTDIECLANQRRCSSGITCIHETAVCDGLADCPEYSDEIGCGNCSESEFHCRSGDQCVLSDRLCDGNTDCADFSDEFDCGPCGESIFDLAGNRSFNISSPGWPIDTYHNRLQCFWLVVAEVGYRIVLTFMDFLIEEGYDFLYCGNGIGFDDDIFVATGGKRFPISLASSGNTMYAKFTSDEFSEERGFLLHVEQKPAKYVSCGEDEIACRTANLICVRNDTSEKGQQLCSTDVCGVLWRVIWNYPVTFTSPGYPSNYPNGIDCIWEIVAWELESILVSIEKFSTERNSDKVRFFVDSSTEAFELHGTTKVRAIAFSATTVKIHFISDLSVTNIGFRFVLYGNYSQEHLAEKPCPDERLFDCGDGSCLSVDARCDGFVDCQTDGRDELDCEMVSCPDFFLCNNSVKCIYWPMVCDGNPDCPNADDETERECETHRCPTGCKCRTINGIYNVACIGGWNQTTIGRIATRVEDLTLSGANVSVLDTGLFKGFSELRVLDISGNLITSFEADWFHELKNLQNLFAWNTSIDWIRNRAFNGLKKLKIMLLIRGKSSIKTAVEVEEDALTDLESFETLYVDDYRLCCEFVELLPHFPVTNCKTTEAQPPLNLCGTLMRNQLLRVSMWVLGLSALIGNAVVIIWRCLQDKEKGGKWIHSSFVLNLAISDLMMGVYMLIIAGADIYFGADYSDVASEWRSSIVCKIAGVMSVLSSEASVFFVTLISLNCFFSIVFPFSRFRIREKSATVIITIIWLAAVCLSVGPTVFVGSDSEVYGLSDVCIGLPLTTVPTSYVIKEHNLGDANTIPIPVGQGNQPAWIYSIILFLGVNLICFVVVLGCYVAIFVKVKRTASRVRNCAHRDREIKMAIKMALIVGTDFACWMPVIIMGILSQTGAVNIGPDMYAWIVVFILPINSSLNPYLYTVYTMVVTKRHAQNSLNESMKSRNTIQMKTKSLETLSSSMSDAKQS
ncbi:uncharacterized protein LOC119725394 [Patiria miniata]|uniref:G-protein coupled receptor GRL101 n=1 Tax=Patiria miniata TaxID=46514 RepID=A0A913ZNV4_PATMI|nr:uncharacterized protein LOC119725394 [Patiria miniata]